jgi:hypothetical protein
MSEPNKAAAEAHKEDSSGAAAEKNEVKEVDPAVVAPTSTASSTPSATPTEAPVMEIDASRSSEVQKDAAIVSTFFVIIAALAAFAAFLTIRNFRSRKTAPIASEVNS